MRAVSQTPPPPRQPVPETVDVAAWRAILAEVRRERPDLASVLGHASPLAVGPELLELAYDPKSFLAERAREEAAVALLEKLARAHFGAETRISIRLDPRAGEMATIAWMDESERHARLQRARKAVAEHPFVRAAIDALGAELREVRLPAEDEA